ncbi:protein of unknown function DUF187 [Caldithrix abyssi DSM 13497]|uniref:Por secretion system C-terminal sorting domain-containing protein n=1 Tax=Caldithrix abyssi DSM 13497 TaxID=880073 RepID=H1XQP2_CALAY|nr:family 10 glycosylhydrolase [Caldithrix abyssi]APF17037.1 Por secretion system C-terminal sorting domain-containing protein [Caldithrix abyssi DSM 13497]EHO41188.1 protein of unknown function DUF187 [Caldithrix abyssi DSM 13497]
MKVLTVISLSVLIFYQCVMALSNPPKREFRAAWIASVANIDWPSGAGQSPAKQKNDLIAMLDELQEAGLNAVLLQIRPECDALYNSNYEPWSYWLTGRQGRAPDPYYDPLQFAIEEAHKRGMELHAWFNPFRAEKTIGAYSLASNHVVVQHPDWILSFTETDSKLRILNPGIPAVRQHITNVIMDVVNRYDVDGVHFDDYFYPYPPNQISNTNKDYQTFLTYKHGDASDNNINDWRRENINLLMKMVHDSIQAVKPWVKFGVSPFGIYKNGVPYGIVGMDAYSVIYCDPLAWLDDGSVDYLTPQLYWKIGGSQDFSKLLTWWADQTYSRGRHLYPGHIFGSSFSVNELPNQLGLVRNNGKALGDIYFSAKHFGYNTLDFANKVKNDYYRFPALVPQMDWKDLTPPEPPVAFYFTQAEADEPFRFQWQAPIASGIDSVIRFAVYRFEQQPSGQTPPTESSYIYKIVGGQEFFPAYRGENYPEVFFALTAIDRNGNESALGPVLRITPPDMPLLAFPENGNTFMPDTIVLNWTVSPGASSFYLEISADSAFGEVDYVADGIKDDSLTITSLLGQTTYFWRVAAQNPAGQSDFSTIYHFTTAFPLPPLLASPADGESEVPLDTVLSWYKNDVATSYRIQLSQASTFVQELMTLDTVVTDTFLVVHNLEPFTRKWYYWRVKAFNEFGQSDWSETFMFRTVTSTYLADLFEGPVDFELKQNYPNPFNPTTSIEYVLPQAEKVTLNIYNVLGQKVITLVDAEQPAGTHRVIFNGQGLAAGVYIYRLQAGSFVQNRKMILIK